jgi:two-component system, NarL family, nitrate/nitrite response regulator NarL
MNARIDDYATRQSTHLASPSHGSARYVDDQRRHVLTPRQMEVLRLVAEGCTDHEIARALYIRTRTATSHMTDIFDKLGVNCRAAAVANAIRRGLI